MKKTFTKIDNGYRVPPSYLGLGYFIERTDYLTEHWYSVYLLENVRTYYDHMYQRTEYDTFKVKELKTFNTLAEAKEWVLNNPRI